MTNFLREALTYSLAQRCSLTESTGALYPVREQRNAWRRLAYELRRLPDGDSFFHLLLRKGSRAEMTVCARMLVPIDQLEDELVRREMPINEAVKGIPESSKVYQLLYNRLLRAYPIALDRLKRVPSAVNHSSQSSVHESVYL